MPTTAPSSNDVITLGAASSHEPVSLCDAIDRVLETGAVLKAEITLSVADVDLVYLNVAALLSSVETARRAVSSPLHRPPAEVTP